jgi:hypothetical protein
MNQETTDAHTRILKCALEVEESRAFWRHVTPGTTPEAQEAATDWWFGARSLDRIRVLLVNFRHRYEDFPEALEVLHGWRQMAPDTRTLICHWHLQLSDPLYRRFTGELLPERRDSVSPTITRDVAIRWFSDHGASRWTMTTLIQFASKTLSAAHAAGLVGSIRDPRPLTLPRVPDDALTYLVYLLRGVRFEGSLLDNPYTRSVGLEGSALEARLRHLPDVRFDRQGELTAFHWAHPDLRTWAAHTVAEEAA